MAIQGEYISVSGEDVPLSRIINSELFVYRFVLTYNERGDFYSMSFYEENGDTILHSSKLVYGRSVTELSDIEDLRGLKIIPLNISYETTGQTYIPVNRENFGGQIQLYTSLEEV